MINLNMSEDFTVRLSKTAENIMKKYGAEPADKK